MIKNSSLPRYFLLYGECDYQVSLYSKKILSSWNSFEDEILSFYFDEYDFKTAKNHLAQSSLFGGNNILLIKTDKTIPKKELDTLISLTKKSENSFFMLISLADQSKAKNLQKAFGKNFARFFNFNLNEAINTLYNSSKNIGLDIDRYALNHLYVLHSENISLCLNELHKLKLLEKKISINDIDNYVYGLGSIGLESFVESLLTIKDIKSIPLMLEQLGGVDEIRVINSIQNFVSTLLMFHLYIKAKGQPNVVEIIGYPLPPKIAQKKAALSLKFDIKTFRTMLDILKDAEFALKKQKNLDKNSYLISTLIKLQSYL